MAKEPTDPGKNTQKEEPSEKTGNSLFKKYGKIFLIAVILLVQGGIAYAVMNTYYQEIYQWLDNLSAEKTAYHSFENIIVNPSQSDGERYLLLSIVVEVGSGSDVALLEQKRAQIIDNVNLILTKRTAEELSVIKGRKKMKQEIGMMINEVINKKAVRNLFFTKYVLQ